MKRILAAVLAVLAAACAVSAASADGVSNRADVLSAVTSAANSSKSRWDDQNAVLRKAVSDLSANWDALSASGGWSQDDAAVLAALGQSPEFFAFKDRLLADFGELSSRLSSRRAADAVALSTISDAITLAYPTLTDAQKADYLARVQSVAAQGTSSLSEIVSDTASFKGRYASNLTAWYPAAVSTFAQQKAAVAAARASKTAVDEANAAAARAASRAAAVTAADRSTIRAAFLALRDARTAVTATFKSRLAESVSGAVASNSDLAAVRSDLDAYAAYLAGDADAKLGQMFSDADKWYFALMNADAYASSGSAVQAYSASGTFQYKDWASTGALAVAQARRDSALQADSALAALSASGALSGLLKDRSADVRTFANTQFSAAQASLNSFVANKAAQLAAESLRIGRLVDIRRAELATGLASADLTAQRQALARFRSVAAQESEGNAAWTARIKAEGDSRQAVLDADQMKLLEARLGAARVAATQSQVNAALRGLVDGAVKNGMADQVVPKFKIVIDRVPAFLDNRLTDTKRYMVMFLRAKMLEFVKKIEG